jgi:uncharacterized membrane protein YjjP (DUF1212 family)
MAKLTCQEIQQIADKATSLGQLDAALARIKQQRKYRLTKCFVIVAFYCLLIALTVLGLILWPS